MTPRTLLWIIGIDNTHAQGLSIPFRLPIVWLRKTRAALNIPPLRPNLVPGPHLIRQMNDGLQFNHRKNIHTKLRVNRRMQALEKARQLKLI